MLNLQEIENTIEELENGDTTFSSCQKLANLYIVRDELKRHEESVETSVENEIRDILPAYRTYCDTKRDYQLRLTTQEAVEHAMQSVCKEVEDLFLLLYANSDFDEERIQIRMLLKRLYTRIMQ